MRFSERHGYRSPSKVFQRESINEELRTHLWNVLCQLLWGRWQSSMIGYRSPETEEIDRIATHLWATHFCKPVDERPTFDPACQDSVFRMMRGVFMEGIWHEAYDLLEAIVKAAPQELQPELVYRLNANLEAQNAAYRFVGLELLETTSDTSISAIEGALKHGPGEVQEHLRRSLELLSDRKAPDYRNAVKEAISAVEALCRRVSGKPKSTLHDCIAKTEVRRLMHPALKEAMTKLYAFTGDSGGIRHALSDTDAPPTYAEALFLLVTSSAFIDYINTRLAENDRC
jgi:hypothetical protein